MALSEQLNIRPLYRTDKPPCHGEAGDLLVLTPLDRNEPDRSDQGEASLWFCTRSSIGDGPEVPAIWKRVQFDGFAMCDQPVPKPPQNLPRLVRG
jgi:hypothetical protein